MTCLIREEVALIRCVFYKRKSAIVRAAALAMAFCILLLSPAVPVRANALTDWEDNLQFDVSAVWGSGSSAWNSSISSGTVACTVENAANVSYYDKFLVVEYAIPLRVTIKGSLVNAYNVGAFKVNVNFTNTVGLGGYSMQGQDIWCDDIYQDYGQYGISANFVRKDNGGNAYVVGSFGPQFMSTENLTEELEFTIHVRQNFFSTDSTGSKVSNLAGHTTMNLSIGSRAFTTKYTYSEEKALEYGAQLKRIEESLASINSNINSTQLALSTAISNQTNALQSSISSAAYDLNNSLITWGGNITGAVNDFRQEILQYMEVSGSHDVIDSSNKTMDTQIKDYNKVESDLMSDASSKLDSVDTTDLSPLKAYEKATTFWTAAVRNLSESIGAFWYIYTFGAMIGLIAFILRLRG